MRAADQIVAFAKRVLTLSERPIVIALDGGSGSGKSTLAGIVRQRLSAAYVMLDDFYTTDVPEANWEQLSIEERLRGVFDWERVRKDAIMPLRAGRPGQWRAFDFEVGLGSEGVYHRKREVTDVQPAAVVLLDGSYSASPPLSDLIDIAVLVDVPVQERHRRTAAREDAAFLDGWHAIWDDVETYYFTEVRPPDSFDLVMPNHGIDAKEARKEE